MKLSNILNLASKDLKVIFNNQPLTGRFIEDNELEWLFTFGTYNNCFSCDQINEAVQTENGFTIKGGYYNKTYNITYKNNVLTIYSDLELFKKLANEYALHQYCIDTVDMCIDESDLKNSFNNNEAPREIIEYFANKWDLVNRFEAGLPN